MLRISKCVVLINHKAGNGHAKHLFEYILQDTLKRAGIPHSIIDVPHTPLSTTTTTTSSASSSSVPYFSTDTAASSSDRAWVTLLQDPSVKALVLCGGDGTLHDVTNVLHRQWYRSGLGTECARLSLTHPKEKVKEEEVETDGVAHTTPTACSSERRVPHHSLPHSSVAKGPPLPSSSSSSDSLAWWRKPLILLPSGVRNSMAYHVGITTPEQTIVSFAAGRTEPIRVWELRLGGTNEVVEEEARHAENQNDTPPTPTPTPTTTLPPPNEEKGEAMWEKGRRPPTDGIRAFHSYIWCGVVVQQHQCWCRLRERWNEYMTLPFISATGAPLGAAAAPSVRVLPMGFMSGGGGSHSRTPLSFSTMSLSFSFFSRWSHAWLQLLSTVYALFCVPLSKRCLWVDVWLTLPATSPPPSLAVSSSSSPPPHESLSADPAAAPQTVVYRLQGPFQLLAVSPFPSQGASCWLTPAARPRSGRLCVTLATARATPLRLLHLLRREVPCGDVLEEDGVCVIPDVLRVQWTPQDQPRSPLSCASSLSLDADSNGAGMACERRGVTNESTATTRRRRNDVKNDPHHPNRDEKGEEASGWMDVLVDGESVQLPLHQSVDIQATTHFLNICSC